MEGVSLTPRRVVSLQEKLDRKVGPWVTDNLLWKSIVMLDMFQKQVGNSNRVQGGDGGDGVDPLRQLIHNNEDGIVPLGVGKLINHVDGDNLPVSVWDLIWDQLPCLQSGEGLCLIACIAPGDELGNVSGQAGPPVVLET